MRAVIRGSSAQLTLVLFDLDGTLIDSAPDLAGTANDMRERRGLPPIPYETLRPLVGMGARGMVRAAFGALPEDAGFEALRDEFLAVYAQRLLRFTRPFDAVPAMLDAIESHGLRWGIVTNKFERFTAPIVDALGFTARAAAIVSGDTMAHAKPHPAPLIEAARRAGVEPATCVYVGDDHRDIVAGRAAGMPTIAAAWGYVGAGESIERWGADHIAASPGEVLKLLGLD